MESNLLQRVYDVTHSGLDIITDLLPAVDDAVINNKKAFRFRPDEHTPSAHLYPPDQKRPYWHVKDFGMGEGGGFFSPIDLFMRERGYAKEQFAMALQDLAEQYGVQEALKQGVNKPEVTKREAMPCEIGKPPKVTLRDGFTASDLSTWGPCVKPEHLKELGWSAVTAVARTDSGMTTIKKATDTYPIYVQDCPWQDAQGNVRSFQKLYEPKNYNKAYRFSIIGEKPQHYIFGLSALRRKFEERGEEKLDEVVLVSGGSDAVNCLSMGYQPVWLGSETEDLLESDYWLLMKYAKRVVVIPDIDATGTRAGRRLALRLTGIYTAWMNDKDMHRLHDNRGRQRKDLKDFIQLNPHRQDMKRLIDRARCAQFWIEMPDKQHPERRQYVISRTSLDYFLWLNGFCTLKDDTRKEPLYVHIEGCRVSRVTAKTIVNFLRQWMTEQGLNEALQNKVLRSRDLPTNQMSTLVERDDLDFTKSTATSQLYYFENCWVEVTAQGIVSHPYSTLNGHYVWEESIVGHNYVSMPPMFKVEKTDDGRYHVTIAENQPSKLLTFVVNTSRLYWRKETEQGITLTIEELADEKLSLFSKLMVIGYLLWGYKSESEAWAPLLQDSTMGETEDECNGRSGKSFLLSAIGKLITSFPIDARVKTVTENRFVFDGVTENTDLIVVDECHKNLDFDFFFSKITGDLRGEEKGNHPFLIPFAQSPKLVFATNYVLRKHDPSTMGRLWPQIFSDYYHVATRQNDYRETRSIRDDFGCDLMGTEYPEQDWQADIAFMLQCLQLYLSLPRKERKVMPPMHSIERREQRAVIGRDFEQWANEYLSADSSNLDCEIKALDMLANFNLETKFGWSLSKFTRHLKDYCEYADHISCLNPATVTGRKADGMPWVKRENGNQVRFYYVQSATASETQPETKEPEEGDLPF